MEICKFDVYAIQHRLLKADTAIRSMLAYGNTNQNKPDVFYEGLTSNLILGQCILGTKFDSAYISPEKNTMVLLMQEGKMTPGRFRILLDQYGITNYILIKSTEIKMDKPKTNGRELCFVKNDEGLTKELEDSQKKGIDTCEYFYNVDGILSLEYPYEVFVAKLQIRGVIVLEDKVVLLLEQGLKENLKPADVLRTFEKNNIFPSMRNDLSIPEEKLKQLVKS